MTIGGSAVAVAEVTVTLGAELPLLGSEGVESVDEPPLAVEA
jgi:hypothetical protein